MRVADEDQHVGGEFGHPERREVEAEAFGPEVLFGEARFDQPAKVGEVRRGRAGAVFQKRGHSDDNEVGGREFLAVHPGQFPRP